MRRMKFGRNVFVRPVMRDVERQRGLVERAARHADAGSLTAKRLPSIGPDDEVMLWMLLSTLISYLNLTDLETPCFNGTPNADTYRDAILFVMKDRRTEDFDVQNYLVALTTDSHSAV